MKTIEQLLELTNNPFYQFLPEEKKTLDAFLSKKRATILKQSQKTNSPVSSPNTPVTVRNVVEPVDTYAPDERNVG